MSNTIVSPNMGLPLPVPGVDPGPDYALNLNASLMAIDGHTHAAGSGVQISPSGLNINSALTFQNNPATNLQASVYAAQSSLATLQAVYVSGVDLYYNDGNGNIIPITANGSVTGASGTITGLPSGTAGAAFNSVSGNFIFTSATSTGAGIDGGTVILHNPTNYAETVTITPYGSPFSSYNLILPPPVAATGFVTLNSSGSLNATGIPTSLGITGSNIANTTITRTKLAAVGQQVSTASGTFTTSSTSFVDITNLSVTITTSGRPVMVFLMADPASTSTPGILQAAGTSAESLITILNGSTVISYNELFGTNLVIPCSSIMTMDTSVVGSPGTYTYKAQGRIVTGTALNVFHAVLVAYEL